MSTSPSRPGPLNTARPRTPSEQWSNPASQGIPALSADITLTLIRQINTAFEDQKHRTTVYYIKLSVKGERKDRLGLFSPWQLRKKKEEGRKGCLEGGHFTMPEATMALPGWFVMGRGRPG